MSGPRASRAIIVVGMHRSGTSLLARLLGRLGVDFGGRAMIEPVPDNAGGYWEHESILEIQETVLDTVLDRPWHRAAGLRPLPDGWWNAPELQPGRDALTEVLREELATARGVFGFKDPRTVRLLPLWRPVFARLSVDPVFVLALRRPEAVAASLTRRQNMAPALGRLLWLQHNLDAVRHLDGEVRMVVDYDRLLEDPTATVRELARRVELANIGHDAVERAVAVVDAAKRHHVVDSGAGDGADGASEEAYALLRTVGEDGRFPERAREMARSFADAAGIVAAAGEEVAAAGRALRDARAAGRALAEANGRLTARAAELGDAMARATGPDRAPAGRAFDGLGIATDLAIELDKAHDTIDKLVGSADPLALFRMLRNSRGWRWSRALRRFREVEIDRMEPTDKFEAALAVAALKGARSWRATGFARRAAGLVPATGAFRPAPGGRAGTVGEEAREPHPIERLRLGRPPLDAEADGEGPGEPPHSRLYRAWAKASEGGAGPSAANPATVKLLARLPNEAGPEAFGAFKAMLESLRAQSHPFWRLHLCLGGARPRELDRLAALEPRLQAVDRPDGLTLAQLLVEPHDWIGWVRLSDTYAPNALARLLAAADPDVDLLYAHFDRIDDRGFRHAPVFVGGPVPIPAFMASRLDGLAIASVGLARSTGLRPCADTQDIYLQHLDWCRALAPGGVRRVEAVLAHRRAASGERSNARSLAFARTLDGSLREDGWSASPRLAAFVDGPGVAFEPRPAAEASILLLVANERESPPAEWLFHLAERSGPGIEIVVLGVPSDDLASTEGRTALLRKARFGSIGENGLAAALAERVAGTDREVVVVLDNDCHPHDDSSIPELVALARASGIGVAGGSVRAEPSLSDGFRAPAPSSIVQFVERVEPRCFAFRRGSLDAPAVLLGRGKPEGAAAALCRAAWKAGLSAAMSRRAVFVYHDAAAPNAPSMSTEDRVLHDAAARLAWAARSSHARLSGAGAPGAGAPLAWDLTEGAGVNRARALPRPEPAANAFRTGARRLFARTRDYRRRYGFLKTVGRILRKIAG